MSVVPYGFISPKVVYATTTDTQRLVVRRAISLTPEESFPLNGMPQVPEVGIKCQSMFSVDGVVFSDRPGLEEINDDSYASFIADDVYWDNVAGIWTPIRDQSPVLYQMLGNPGAYPSILEVDYRVTKELIIHDAFQFGTETLHTDFNEGLDDATNFTMAFALSPLDSGPNELVTFSDGSTVSIVPSGLQGFMDGKTWRVDIPSGPMKLGPLYVVLELKPPIATLYAGLSPGIIYRGSSTISRIVTKFDFVIGSPMYLFALDLWGDDAPTASDIISRYSSVLGSSDTAIGAFA